MISLIKKNNSWYFEGKAQTKAMTGTFDGSTGKLFIFIIIEIKTSTKKKTCILLKFYWALCQNNTKLKTVALKLISIQASFLTVLRNCHWLIFKTSWYGTSSLFSFSWKKDFHVLYNTVGIITNKTRNYFCMLWLWSL